MRMKPLNLARPIHSEDFMREERRRKLLSFDALPITPEECKLVEEEIKRRQKVLEDVRAAEKRESEMRAYKRECEDKINGHQHTPNSGFMYQEYHNIVTPEKKYKLVDAPNPAGYKNWNQKIRVEDNEDVEGDKES